MGKHRGGDGFLKTVTERGGWFYSATKLDGAARETELWFENQPKPLKPPRRDTGEHAKACKCIKCLAERQGV